MRWFVILVGFGSGDGVELEDCLKRGAGAGLKTFGGLFGMRFRGVEFGGYGAFDFGDSVSFEGSGWNFFGFLRWFCGGVSGVCFLVLGFWWGGFGFLSKIFRQRRSPS